MPAPVTRRPDPDRLLRQAEAEERHERRGHLKVFLGYASGVGKSLQMFDEGRRRGERGQDVVVGATQPVIPDKLQSILHAIEVIPPRMVEGTPVMDVEAILARHPGVCLVDGLAYDNPAGSRNPSRWRDVEQILDAGISVVTSVNLQFIEERHAEVERITGRHVDQTIPESFLRTADEIVVVDAPPGLALRGNEAVLARQLSELREIALVLAAEVVDHQLESYLEIHGIERAWGTQERILVCITPRTNAARMIESGRRNADRLHGELFAAHVRQPDLSADDQPALDRNLSLARAAKARIEVLEGTDPIQTILAFAREHGITQIFIGHSLREGWRERLFGSPVDRLIAAADGMDVRIFPH